MKRIGSLFLFFAISTSSFAGAPVIPGWYSLAVNALSINIGIALCRDIHPQYAAANDTAYSESVFSAVDHEKLFRFLLPKAEMDRYPQQREKIRKAAADGLANNTPEKREAICRDLAQNILKISEQLSGR